MKLLIHFIRAWVYLYDERYERQDWRHVTSFLDLYIKKRKEMNPSAKWDKMWLQADNCTRENKCQFMVYLDDRSNSNRSNEINSF